MIIGLYIVLLAIVSTSKTGEKFVKYTLLNIFFGVIKSKGYYCFESHPLTFEQQEGQFYHLNRC